MILIPMLSFDIGAEWVEGVWRKHVNTGSGAKRGHEGVAGWKGGRWR
jgi:hypothetical protein